VQKLVCELCGSNDFTKDNEGYFVCDYCRTKYTPEQAKSMIVEGTVRVDRSGEAASLLTLAGTALAGNNVQEAYDYANRALEINPEDATAWYLKGTAAGSLSTLQQPRLSELLHAYTLAMQKASDGERPSMMQWCSERTTTISGYLANASMAQVRQYPTAVGVWEGHINLTGEVLNLLGAAYQWFPNPVPLTTRIAIAADLINGVPYRIVADGRRAQHRTAPDYREYLQEQINWAGDQMRYFDPSFVAPQLVRQRKRRRT
jgi:hypothetical protein